MTKLSVELLQRERSSEMRFKGILDSESVGQLQGQIDQLSCGRCDKVVFDVSELSQVDAVGKSALEGLCNYIIFRGGDAVISGLTETGLPYATANIRADSPRSADFSLVKHESMELI